MRRVATTLLALMLLHGCGPEPASTDSGTATEDATGTDATGSSGTGDGGSTAPTTDVVPTTGEPSTCVPSGGPITEDMFATRFAEAICAQKQACGCEAEPGCVAAFTQQFELVRQSAQESAPHYDQACAGEMLAALVEQRGCALKSEWGATDICWSWCRVFRGDIPSGGACSPADNLDASVYIEECAVPGEWCQSPTGTCSSNEVNLAGLGEECISADYKTSVFCEEGLLCNFESRVCVPVVGEGEACGNFAECGAGLWCDQQGTCRPDKPAGAPCEAASECASFECINGACVDEVLICSVDSPGELLHAAI